LQFLIDLRN